MTDSRVSGFKQRLAQGEPMIGTWVKTPSPVVCEVLCRTELDALALDAEHSPFGRLELDGCLAVSRLADMPTLVRVPSASPADLLNALDCGATGVVVPHVTTTQQAEAVATACHFGRGGRGFAGSTRAAEFGGKKMPDHLADSRQQTIVVAQIEDVEAVDAIDEIAAVEGIDCLFVGRIDLTVALGAESPNSPEVIEAVATVCAAGKRAGRPVGMFVADTAEAPRWIEAGASLFLLGSDQGFLTAGANELVGAFHTPQSS